jgi:hypothetical protein
VSWLSRAAKVLAATSAVTLGVAGSASAASRHCSPSRAERQNGVKEITTTASCKVADHLASFTSLPRSKFRYAGRTWVAYVSHSGGFKYVYATQAGTPSLMVTVRFS